jgi:hypothetical protein
MMNGALEDTRPLQLREFSVQRGSDQVGRLCAQPIVSAIAARCRTVECLTSRSALSLDGDVKGIVCRERHLREGS